MASVESTGLINPIIVSGLARSGTSMMMRMLEVGGVPVVYDDVAPTPALVWNPHGYYESMIMHDFRERPELLDRLAGKAIKMFASYVYELPLDRTYRVIVMQRNPREIVASQQRIDCYYDRDNLLDEYARIESARQVDFRLWLTAQDNMQAEFVWYHDLFVAPRESLLRVAALLDCDLDIQRMSSVIDPQLYRCRDGS